MVTQNNFRNFTSMKVLVIEDEKNIASVISRALADQGFTVQTAYDGETGMDLLSEKPFDVVILDVILPRINGWEVCQRIRAGQEPHPAILMLTALSTTDNVVKGLNLGADDYLPKPFKINELVARVNALHRRSSSNRFQTIASILTFGDVELNLDTMEASREGVKLKLTPRELRLLEFFMRNPNKVLTRQEILDTVWGVDFDTGTNVVDVYVSYLRSKLEKPNRRKLLHTAVGLGYILKSENDVS